VRGRAGKIAIVAGGAGGIGTATSVRLGEEGAMVVVGDIDAEAAEEVAGRITGGGGRAVGWQSDISDEQQVRDLVERAVKKLGQLDIFHANGADLAPDNIGRDSDAVEIPLEVFDRTIAVNLRGHLLGARHAIPEMLKRGGGALVFTSSGAAFVGEPTRPAYAMAKSGINALVRHIASRWGKEGIRANAVAPGPVLTDNVRSGMSPEVLDQYLQATRSRRLGRPDDIAAMVAFLASDDGEWVNGQVFGVDGGVLLR
jgi:NAD(P)-dependent dehydrogenase (short-subunit alcohol dehydrogenase family)